MKIKELASLKYYILVVLMALSFYVYSGIVGWKWLGATSTEKDKPERGQSQQQRYFHK